MNFEYGFQLNALDATSEYIRSLDGQAPKYFSLLLDETDFTLHNKWIDAKGIIHGAADAPASVEELQVSHVQEHLKTFKILLDTFEDKTATTEQSKSAFEGAISLFEAATRYYQPLLVGKLAKLEKKLEKIEKTSTDEEKKNYINIKTRTIFQCTIEEYKRNITLLT